MAKAVKWMGWSLSVIVTLFLLMGAFMSLTKNPQALEGMAKTGWPESIAPLVATLALVSAGLYIIPVTNILGAILLTGYLGGAVATHLRIGESPAAAVIVGVVAWAGIYLREPRLRALVPIRRTQ